MRWHYPAGIVALIALLALTVVSRSKKIRRTWKLDHMRPLQGRGQRGPSTTPAMAMRYQNAATERDAAIADKLSELARG